MIPNKIPRQLRHQRRRPRKTSSFCIHMSIIKKLRNKSEKKTQFYTDYQINYISVPFFRRWRTQFRLLQINNPPIVFLTIYLMIICYVLRLNQKPQPQQSSRITITFKSIKPQSQIFLIRKPIENVSKHIRVDFMKTVVPQT